MKEGVTFKLPETCYIEDDVKIGRDTVVGPNCYITGSSVVGEKCSIGASCIIENQHIANGTVIEPGTIITG